MITAQEMQGNKNRERIIYYINIFNLCAYCWITDYT